MQGCRFIVALILLAGVAVIAGCGGGDSDASGGGGSTVDAASTPPGDGFSKAEYIDQANAVCAARSAEVKVKGQRLFKQIFRDPQPVAAKKMADQVIIPGFEGELNDLLALNVPTEGGNQVSAIYAAIRHMVNELKKDPTWGEFYPYTKAETLAAKYGLTACGHP